MNYQAVRGTRDILPDEAIRVAFMEHAAREMFARYGYREIRTPTFELAEVFTRSVGESTDIVEKEIYAFDDKKGRHLALRPEGTAPIVRAAIENNLFRDLPGAKLCYLGPMFRYERPQAGRYREFLQIGVEYFGSERPEADAEVVSLAWDYLDSVGLKGLRLELSSLGCAADRDGYRAALTAFVEGIGEQGLCQDCNRRRARNVLRVLDCRVDGEKMSSAPTMKDHLCDACRGHFNSVKACLDEMEIEVHVNWRIVRGLDYYSRTVFEIKPEQRPAAGGAQDTLAAGGRYDGLVKEMGGPPIPGVGFALGVDRVLEALTLQEVLLPIQQGKDVFVAVAGTVSRSLILRILRELRRAHLNTDIIYEEKPLKAQMALADKLQARYTVILGEEEARRGMAIVRNMKSETQEEVGLRDIRTYLLKKIPRIPHSPT